MPIRRIFHWPPEKGRDIHLLRGESSRNLLADSLWVQRADEESQSAQDYFNEHPDTDERIHFRPTFKAEKVGNEWTGFGIKVNEETGAVSFDAGPAPDPAPANFIIEARVKIGGIDHDKIKPAAIRIHVHAAATRMWLTPKRMTVPRRTFSDSDRTAYRFTVRVEFSDGTVGDLTEHHHVTWGPAENIYYWGGDGYLRIPAGIDAEDEVLIEARWSSFAGSLSDTATMVVAGPWASGPTMPKAELLDGHPDTWAGTIDPETVPNVLIFSAGFSRREESGVVVVDDLPAFKAITDKIVHDLKTDPLTRPFDRLATSMNYWRVAVPSTNRGISVRCEVFRKDDRLLASTVPPALPPPADGMWKVQHLIYAVGLPLPSDVPRDDETDTQKADRRRALRDRWNAVARTPPPSGVLFDVLSDEVIDQWARIGTRTFIDEIDAFPAMALGEPPSMSEDTDHPLLSLHPDRGALRKDFYRALVAANHVELGQGGPGNNLGAIWADDRPTSHFDNRPLVAFLSAFKGGRANRRETNINISVKGGNFPIPITEVGDGRNALAIDQAVAPPATVDGAVWRVIAHELGHAFGLGDEYVELPDRYTASESTLDSYGNLTTETAVKDSAGNFRSDRIKWNWRRVRKAAVLREPITPLAGADFEMKVGHPEAFQFAAGEKVRLRRRSWKEVLNYDPLECELEVVSSNPSGDALIVRGSLSLMQLALFLKGSVVYLPVAMPDGSAGEARLIAPKIAKFIDDNNRPLTAWPCNPDAEVERGSDPQSPEFALFSDLWSRRDNQRVVGLYSGGRKSGCGIFHPTGFCMMRNEYPDKSQFCAVCKFVLVDRIDPFIHLWIDREYDAIYPD